MSAPQLVRYYHPDYGACIGLRVGDVVRDITDQFATIAGWLRESERRVDQLIEQTQSIAAEASQTHQAASLDTVPSEDHLHWLAPVDSQDVWAAGVTYERSRAARQEESIDGGDIYARVYRAERPEIFFKAHGRAVIGPYGKVGIRSDATWSVPEPELGLVINPAMEVVGFTVGNDMSSRDIEGENPLYLPQAKVYTASCALGPGILLAPSSDWPDATIRLMIRRESTTVFEDEIHTDRIVRSIADLVGYLGRSNSFPDGVVLLTGTGIVPPGDFTLAEGDEITIAIDDIGTLINTVKVM